MHSPDTHMTPDELRAVRVLLSPPGELMSWEDFGRLFDRCGRTMRRYARGEAARGIPYTVAQEARRLRVERLIQ